MDPSTVTATTSIALEPFDQSEVLALIAEADAYLDGLYPPDSRHSPDLDRLRAPDMRFAAARRDGTVVGCAALMVKPGGRGELKRMYVARAARGLKVGRDLLRFIEDLARRHGLHLMQLETGIHQTEALGLYRSHGYREIPPFPPYRQDPLSICLEKRLDAASDAHPHGPVIRTDRFVRDHPDPLKWIKTSGGSEGP